MSSAAGMRVQFQVQHDSEPVEVQQTYQRSRRPFSEYWDVYCEGVQASAYGRLLACGMLPGGGRGSAEHAGRV
jgi:hypothetical protein